MLRVSADRLAQELGRLGWTPSRLGVEAEVDRDTVYRIVNAPSRVVPCQAKVVAKIARALGIDVKQLLADEVSVDEQDPVPPGLACHYLRFDALLNEHVRHFVGRKHVYDKLDDFLTQSGLCSGYFVIEGKPGMGKSAFLADLVKRHHHRVHHFNVSTQGINSVEGFLGNICARLIRWYKLPYPQLPSDLGKDGAFLSKLLHDASARLKPKARIVIPVDALDEVQSPEQPGMSNTLFLPPTLPERVFFVVTTRDIEATTLRVANRYVFHLDPDDHNKKDICTYIDIQTGNIAIREWMKGQRISVSTFSTILQSKSQGNFMFVRSVLFDIRQGIYKDASLEAIPDGLDAYYEGHWRRMARGTTHRTQKLRILYMLCQLGRPISRDLLVDFCKEDPIVVQEVLDEWRQFLDRKDSQYGVQYSLYHASFRDFLHRKEIVRAAGVNLRDIDEDINDNLQGK